MKNRPDFRAHPSDTPSTMMVRLHKHIRSMYEGQYSPKSIYAAKVQQQKAVKPVLRIVK